MEYTTNLNLKKPDVNEYYNIEQENENKDLIDTAVGKLNSQVGTETLTTKAQNCTGAINELNKNFLDYVVIFQAKLDGLSVEIESKTIKNIDFPTEVVTAAVPEGYKVVSTVPYYCHVTGNVGLFRQYAVTGARRLLVYNYSGVTTTITEITNSYLAVKDI